MNLLFAKLYLLGGDIQRHKLWLLSSRSFLGRQHRHLAKDYLYQRMTVGGTKGKHRLQERLCWAGIGREGFLVEVTYV